MRSRGVGEFRLVGAHALKPALIPIITVMGLQIAMLLGGSVLTEVDILGVDHGKALALWKFRSAQTRSARYGSIPSTG